ncbi:hypothetical protein HNY73_015542 [Argiope bruennichi]|uniref:Uncharacterized protein n=1 Tax=Argiope bruennichi TaxID=94029 RepID=A0A8T0ESY0_ARGBR|nr:hypothetical protein HNY73_015542 [Argiope bruennichi]
MTDQEVFLSPDELRQAELSLVSLVQQSEFAKEMKDLRCSGEVSKQSQVKNLHPLMIKAGILRVGGRLPNIRLLFSFTNATPQILVLSDPEIIQILSYPDPILILSGDHPDPGNIKSQLAKLNNALTEGQNKMDFPELQAQLDIVRNIECKFKQLKDDYYRIAKEEDFQKIETSLFEVNEDIQKLEIPKLSHNSREEADEIEDILENLYTNRNMSQESWSHWTWDVPILSGPYSEESEMTTSLIWGSGLTLVTCYSANLRLSNELPARTWPIDSFYDSLEDFTLNVEEDEAFYPWKVPNVAIAIHSPFVPAHAFDEGKLLKIGYMYQISVKLEEEHLLPHPYITDCTDYDEFWRENNKTGPRSQEVITISLPNL